MVVEELFFVSFSQIKKQRRNEFDLAAGLIMNGRLDQSRSWRENPIDKVDFFESFSINEPNCLWIFVFDSFNE